MMIQKVSSVVDVATGAALDFTLDSPSINGEKLEVKLEKYVAFLVLPLVQQKEKFPRLMGCPQWTVLVSMGRSWR